MSKVSSLFLITTLTFVRVWYYTKWFWLHRKTLEFQCGEWWIGWNWGPELHSFFSPFNYLDKDIRYFGPRVHYYDGTFYSFGFWFFNVSIAF